MNLLDQKSHFDKSKDKQKQKRKCIMEELKNIKVALLGSGTVGTGVYKLIERQREELPHKVGAGLTVSKVLVRDKNKKREGIDPSVLTDQWEDIITDDEIQIVVEVMGESNPPVLILQKLFRQVRMLSQRTKT